MPVTVQTDAVVSQADAARNGTVVFCDLDGTLVLDNSFHVFLATAWARGSMRLRFGLLRAASARLLGRFGGGHAGLKRRVLRCVSRLPEPERTTIVAATLERLEATVSGPISRILDAWRRRGARLVLATAAPDLYAAALARTRGMECLATKSDVGPGWSELLAGRKAEACRALLATGPRGRVVVLTDHPDDLPLIEIADEAVIQAPPQRYARMVAALGERSGALVSTRTELVHVDPTSAEDGGGYWLWIDDRPHGPLDHWEVRTILSKHRHALLYQGDGRWRRTGPGQELSGVASRRDCPMPPSSRQRLLTHLRRRLVRDWLGIFH